MDVRRCPCCKTEWVLDDQTICPLCELEREKHALEELWFESRLTHNDKKFLKSIKVGC